MATPPSNQGHLGSGIDSAQGDHQALLKQQSNDSPSQRFARPPALPTGASLSVPAAPVNSNMGGHRPLALPVATGGYLQQNIPGNSHSGPVGPRPFTAQGNSFRELTSTNQSAGQFNSAQNANSISMNQRSQLGAGGLGEQPGSATPNYGRSNAFPPSGMPALYQAGGRMLRWNELSPARQELEMQKYLQYSPPQRRDVAGALSANSQGAYLPMQDATNIKVQRAPGNQQSYQNVSNFGGKPQSVPRNMPLQTNSSQQLVSTTQPTVGSQGMVNSVPPPPPPVQSAESKQNNITSSNDDLLPSRRNRSINGEGDDLNTKKTRVVGANASDGSAIKTQPQIIGSLANMNLQSLSNANLLKPTDSVSEALTKSAPVVDVHSSRPLPHNPNTGSLSVEGLDSSAPNGEDGKKRRSSLKVNDALRYLEEVKKHYEDRNPEIYARFLDIMKYFKTGKVDTPGVIKEVLILFKDVIELLAGFNDFLPQGYKIDVQTNVSPPQIYIHTANRKPILVDVHDPASIKAFSKRVRAMGLEEREAKDRKETKEKNYKNVQTTVEPQHIKDDAMEHISLVPESKQEEQQSVPAAKDIQPLHQLKVAQPQVPLMMVGDGNTLDVSQAQLQSLLSKLDVANMSILPQPDFRGFPPSLNSFHQLMGQGFLPPPMTTFMPPKPVLDFNDIRAHGIGFNQMMPPVQAQTADPDNPQEFSQAIDYVSKIKKRFSHDSDAYRSFLEILHRYQRENGTIKSVLNRVSKLFDGHNDLLKEFCYFLPDSAREKARKIVDKMLKDKQNGHVSYERTAVVRLGDRFGERLMWQKFKLKLGDDARFIQFVGLLEMFVSGVISRMEFLELVEDLLLTNNPILDPQSETLLIQLNSFLSSHNAANSAVVSAFYSVPLSDLDFAESFRPTPSYRRLPDKYLKMSSTDDHRTTIQYGINVCSSRTRLCDSVLNDEYVSVPTGSEDFSFKHFRRNAYEEALFRCEDERYLLDMIIEANNETIMQLSKIQAELDKLSPNSESTSIKEGLVSFRLGRYTLTVLHLKAISRVYGTMSAEIIEYLRLNPKLAVPIVLRRLRQKQFELHDFRKEKNQEWKKVQENNFPKSLDHRSFYFKQSDRKDIGTKNLLGQIRSLFKGNLDGLKGATLRFTKFCLPDLKDRDNFGADEAVLESANDSHMELMFDDPTVHCDCFGIMMFALKKSAIGVKSNNNSLQTATQKLMIFIVGFWARFLGVSSAELLDISRSMVPSSKLSVDFEVSDLMVSKYGRQLLERLRARTRSGQKHGSVNVLTGYGTGTLGDISGDIVQVNLLYGKGYFSLRYLEKLNPGTSFFPLPAEEIFAGLLEDFSSIEKPVTVYGSSSLYLFVRLYNIFYERMLRCKEECRHVVSSAAHNLALSKEELDRSVQEKYVAVVNSILELLAGDISIGHFEDRCRETLMSGSYFLFTIEKLVSLLEKHTDAALLDEEKVNLFNFKWQSLTAHMNLDNVVGFYRQTYQSLMNQVDGLCYKLEFIPGKRASNELEGFRQSQPIVKITMVNNFPSHDALANNNFPGPNLITVLRPFVISLEAKSNIPAKYHQVAYPIFVVDQITAEESLSASMEPISQAYKQRLQSEAVSSIRGAKDTWWFFNTYEELKRSPRDQDNMNAMNVVKSNSGEGVTKADEDDSKSSLDIDEADKMDEDGEENDGPVDIAQDDDEEDAMDMEGSEE